ncbi:MAG: hypothetical protein ACJ73E_17810 [Mycobacteriales bacterium]
MTAEALSAAADLSPQAAADDGSPRPAPDGDAAPALLEARQSVVDVVAARLGQVVEPEDAGANGGLHRDRTPPKDAPPDRVPANEPPVDEPAVDEAAVDEAAVDEAAVDEAAAVQAGAVAPPGEEDRSDLTAEVRRILEPTGDAGRLAATAVLDVLRASGWADADEARRLRAEADRLRELLDLVVRDHRAREASAAGVESEQHHWLIPLLRAAHGVAFGSLGAKVALRTAVQEVPEQILAAAGLRIDYGIEHTGEEYEER